MEFTPKGKPNGVRDWIAWKLVRLAQLIKPKNEAAMAYIAQISTEMMMEQLLYVKSELEVKVKKQQVK